MGVSRARGYRNCAGPCLLVLLGAFSPMLHADERLADLLESRALEGSSNPVPVNYLLNEGCGKLDADTEDAARG